MDIRNWFSTSLKGAGGLKDRKATKPESINQKSPQKDVKKKKRRIVDSDSDEEVDKKKSKPSKNGTKRLSSEQKPKNLKNKKSELSSDEDCVLVSDSDSSSTRRSPRKLHASTDQKKVVSKKPELPVSVSSFFGSAPVQRLMKKPQKDQSSHIAKEINHEDDDFNKTLSQLDHISNLVHSKKVDEVKKGKHSPTKGSHGKTSKKRLTSMEITPPPPEMKKKLPVQTPPEKKSHPAKKGNAALYFSYLNRQGPSALGSKEIPQGERDCLKGKTFVITGVLESIERDDAKEIIEKYGGKLMTTLSKKTNYVIIGRDAGVSKLDKAIQLGTPQLDEDGFFDLIRTSPGTGPMEKQATPECSVPVCDVEEKPVVSDRKFNEQLEQFAMKAKVKKTDHVPAEEKETITSKGVAVEPASISQSGFEMWVDKYKPQSLKKVIGQQGPSSNANKLLNWLHNWKKYSTNKKAAGGRWGGNNDGSGFKAALLSGPPGVGKTTTAQLVCKELGFDYFELNASDTRSKKCLQSVVSELLMNQSLSSCFKASGKRTVSSDHVVIMDEVDGMAGNKDRGGIQELIAFIKMSKIPIICICNDRNHQKMRSLSNYCFDLRFQKPRFEQIKAAMLSITYKEGIEIAPNVLSEVITASNQDIRQVLHNLSVWCSKRKGLSEEQAKKDIGHGTKHVKMSPFDALREVFAIGNKKTATLNDKSDLFFHDYSLAPLFVQENYVHVLPSAAGNDQKKHLQLISEAADSICIGDLVDKQIRSRSSWNLLPVQAIYASVVPGALLTGHLRQMISFPAWLGKNSNRNHMNRILQELQMHMRMRITGDKTDVALDYLPVLKRSLTEPLIKKETDGVIDVLRVMNSYYLLREDFDSIIDLSLWSHQTDPKTQISTKVKSAFTRAYNKQCRQNPYAMTSGVKKKKGAPNYSEEMPDEETEEHAPEEDSEDESIENNAMIKVKKQTSKKNSESASTSKPPAKKSRGKK